MPELKGKNVAEPIARFSPIWLGRSFIVPRKRRRRVVVFTVPLSTNISKTKLRSLRPTKKERNTTLFRLRTYSNTCVLLLTLTALREAVLLKRVFERTTPKTTGGSDKIDGEQVAGGRQTSSLRTKWQTRTWQKTFYANTFWQNEPELG